MIEHLQVKHRAHLISNMLQINGYNFCPHCLRVFNRKVDMDMHVRFSHENLTNGDKNLELGKVLFSLIFIKIKDLLECKRRIILSTDEF